MKISTYKNQKDIEKTFEIEAYDLMYGTVEDLLNILDGVTENGSDETAMFKVISDNKTIINDLLQDIFPDMTDEDIRKIKLKDLIPFFKELFEYVILTFKKEKN